MWLTQNMKWVESVTQTVGHGSKRVGDVAERRDRHQSWADAADDEVGDGQVDDQDVHAGSQSPASEKWNEFT